jgi:hypothetical protein
MTPTQLIERARNKYNSIGDSFWSDQEILDLFTDACTEAAQEALCIERTYTTTTVAGTQEYDFPTNTIAIKRVTYNGQKLKKISFREDDAVTGLNSDTTTQGTPTYYYTWNYTIALRPLPDAANTLKIYSYNEPAALTITSVVEVPTVFHMRLVDYVLAEMAAKDSNAEAAKYYINRWELAKVAMKKWVAKRKRTDSFGVVQDEDQLIESYMGFV